MRVSDEEKARFGRDLHDSLCQNLAGIAALSTTLSRQLAPQNKVASAAAAEINRLLGDTIVEARNLARGLNPLELDGSGLIGALDTLAVSTRALFHISCTFLCNRPSVRLGADVETHLYRIAQEAVRNAVSHGRATEVSVTLHLEKTEGLLTIADDGVGIAADAGHGSGMHTMKYRAHRIGASLRVRPRRDHGTCVECVFGLLTADSDAASHG